MNDYRGEDYKLYFLTPHWVHLKEKLIYSNPNAKCWICEITYNLLPHHEKYENLFHERLNRDIFILCFDCHSSLHFYRFSLFGHYKTKLSYLSLKRRRLFLRMCFLLRKHRFALALWYLFRYTFII